MFFNNGNNSDIFVLGDYIIREVFLKVSSLDKSLTIVNPSFRFSPN